MSCRFILIIGRYQSCVPGFLQPNMRLDGDRSPTSGRNGVLEVLTPPHLEGRSTKVSARGIHELWVACAARAPGACALVEGSVRVSNAQLAARASAVAEQLRLLPVVAGDRVALYAHMSTDYLAAVLGVVACGCTYVPIDAGLSANAPSYAASLLTMAECVALLAIEDVPSALTRECPRVLQLPPWSEGDTDVSISPTLNGSSVTDINTAACLICTSGSTGAPKGVILSHGNILTRVSWASNYYPMADSDVLFVPFGISTLGGTLPPLQALLQGRTVSLPPRGLTKSPSMLARQMTADGVRHAILVPSLVNALLEVEPDAIWRLRVLFLTGEATSAGLLQRLQKLRSGSKHPMHVLNLYGLTETCGHTCWHTYLGDETKVRLGLPTENTSLWLRGHEEEANCGANSGANDRANGGANGGAGAGTEWQLAKRDAEGFVGELCVGGGGVALGYWKQEEMTRERFLKHATRDERIFPTGDVVRLCGDGVLEYIGRRDRQVQVRGFRVELDGIETAIRAIDGVQQAAVVMQRHHDERETATTDTKADGDGGGDSGSGVLIAYVTPSTLSSHALLQLLTESLPTHALPRAVVPLRSMPLTPSGKLDRLKLPRWQQPHESGDDAASAARHETFVLMDSLLTTSASATRDQWEQHMALSNLKGIGLALVIFFHWSSLREDPFQTATPEWNPPLVECSLDMSFQLSDLYPKVYFTHTEKCGEGAQVLSLLSSASALQLFFVIAGHADRNAGSLRELARITLRTCVLSFFLMWLFYFSRMPHLVHALYQVVSSHAAPHHPLHSI